MATIAERISVPERVPDLLSGAPRAHPIDLWIFVFMAAWFIVIVLVGFIPDSFEKVAAVRDEVRPAFPLAMHFHAILMGSFLLMLLAQTLLPATGRGALHKQLGIVGIVIATALIVAGFILAPTNYQSVVQAANFGPPAMREAMAPWVLALENILLLQGRAGILFALFITVAVRARGDNAGLHKRMMILATAIPLEAAFARMTWLPTTMPASPTSLLVYVLLAVAPMFAWDVIRNRRVHVAYAIWLGGCILFEVAVHLLWDTPWWHTIARQVLVI
jgi:multidrug transporter EmrE-like cation transporter